MGIYSFPPSRKIRHKRDFSDAIKEGVRFRGSMMLIQYRENGLPFSRMGISIGKRYGSAVKRNRFKRLVREAYRMRKDLLPPCDLVVMPVLPSVNPDLQTCLKEFSKIVKYCKRNPA